MEKKYKCFYCERRIGEPKSEKLNTLLLTVDHIIPKIKGGTNDISNLIESCHFCNSFKNALLLKDFIDELQRRINVNEGIVGQFSVPRFKIVQKNAIKLLLNDCKNPDTTIISEIVATKKKFQKTIKPISKPRKALVYEDLSINTNVTRLQTKEHVLYLQSQTLEQFLERKRINQIVKKLLSAPDPDFHEK